LPVKITIKTLFVLLLSLALPLQSYAAATRLPCAPQGAADFVVHSTIVHAASSTAGPQATSAPQPHEEHTGAHHHSDHKCGACAHCCFGAVITPSFVPALPDWPARERARVLDMTPLVSVDLALPERPPRG
jgi:hypothetical protein